MFTFSIRESFDKIWQRIMCELWKWKYSLENTFLFGCIFSIFTGYRWSFRGFCYFMKYSHNHNKNNWKSTANTKLCLALQLRCRAKKHSKPQSTHSHAHRHTDVHTHTYVSWFAGQCSQCQKDFGKKLAPKMKSQIFSVVYCAFVI